MRTLRFFWTCSVVMLIGSALALAQTGSIQGIVTDSTGGVVPGAEITVRNLGTNASRMVLSSDVGTYAAPDLAIGHYEIMVKKASFKVFHVENLQLTVAQALTVNARLEPGAVTEQVDVRARLFQDVDLETSQVSNLVDQSQIEGLPLITRNPYRLVLLSQGTVLTNSPLGGITVNGSRERNNNFLLDGVDNNDTSVPGIIGGVLDMNPDSTQEFRVITNNFNPEFGRNTGSIVDVVSRSGTNSFHGGAYEFGRWNGFGGARDWFNPASQGPQNPYVRNQFGYSVGGPIRKDKTFIFFNQEFHRFVTSLTNSVTVPTAAFKTGVFTYIDPNGNAVPVDLRPGATPGSNSQNPNDLPLDQTMQKVLALYPNPTVSNGDGFSGQLLFPSKSQENTYLTVAKIDHHFNDRHTLSLRYGYDHFYDPDPSHRDLLPGGVGSFSEKAIKDGLAASLTSTFRSNLINNLSFGWSHIYANFACTGLRVVDSISQSDGTLDRFGNGRDYVMDPFSNFGCTQGYDNAYRTTGTVSYSDDISWVRGAHTFKFGGDFRSVGESGPSNFFARRQVSLDPVLLGFSNPIYDPINVANSTASLEDAAAALYGLVFEDFNGEYFNKTAVRQPTDNKLFRQHELDGYAQDTWRVRPNLTVNFGLRYQFNGVPYERNANFSNLLTDPASFPVVLSIVGPGTGKQLYHNDYSGIEPRIGFSWDPWNSGKTSIRAAFGIFHDRVFGNLFENARGNPPLEQDYLQFPVQTVNSALPAGGSYNGFPNLVGGFPAVLPDTTPSANIPDHAALAPIIFDTHFRPLSSNNWSFGVQHQLSGNDTAEVSYVGSKGTHLYMQVDGNPPNPALVAQLVSYCSNPNNVFGCTPDQVSNFNLYFGGDFGILPFNAVAHNAMYQPFYQRSVGDSLYNALQLKLTHRVTHGLQVQGVYTWSHALDDATDPLAPALGNHTYPRNSLNIRQDWGNSDNDVRHVAAISYIWQVPVGRGSSYLNRGMLGRVFEGIELSGITSIHSGHPFEIVSNTDSQRTGIVAWGELIGNPYAPGRNSGLAGEKAFFTNPVAFGEPPYGGPSNIGRNQFYGPKYVDFDMALAKNFKLTERFQLKMRFEGYNVFNHPQFSNPGNNVGSPLLGVITSTLSQPDGTTSARQIQAALKLNF
jgi:hypothetical protein